LAPVNPFRRPRGRFRSTRAPRDPGLAGRQPRPSGPPAHRPPMAAGFIGRERLRGRPRPGGGPHGLAHGRHRHHRGLGRAAPRTARPARRGDVRRGRGRWHLGRALRRHPLVLRRPRLVEPPRLRLRVGADPGGRLSRLAGRWPPGGQRGGPGRAANLHAEGPGPAAAHHRGRAGPPGRTGRAARGRARPGGVPRVRGQRAAAGPHPGRRQRARRGDAPSRHAAAPRPERSPGAAAQGEHHPRPAPGLLTLLGHEDVAVYDGGWAEWGDRLDLPVDR